MEFVPDSDEEKLKSPIYSRDKHDRCDAHKDDEDRIYSDGDDCAWSIGVPETGTATCSQQPEEDHSRGIERIHLPFKRRRIVRPASHTISAAPAAHRHKHHFLSSAAATVDNEATQTQHNHAIINSETLAGEINWTMVDANRVSMLPHNFNNKGPAFIGRPRLPQQTGPDQVEQVPPPAMQTFNEMENWNKRVSSSDPTGNDAGAGITSSTRNSNRLLAPQSNPPIEPAPPPVLDGMMVPKNEGDDVFVVYNRRPKSTPDDQNGPTADQTGKKQSRVNSGWGNNFVRIDLKKGKGSTKFKASRHSYSRRRPGRGRGRWKEQRLRQVGDGAEFMEGWETGYKTNSRCFKCGESGHWANECPQQNALDVGSDDCDDVDEPLQTGVSKARVMQAAVITTGVSEQQPSSPDFDALDVEALCDPDTMADALRNTFGFSAFRGLQVPTIQKVLRGESCLTIMPTGMGKSLCYQLPAVLLPGLTLVISPLIALMHDQCRAAPQELHAAVLWSGQTPADARQILADVADGKCRLLFVSPERIGNPHLLAALRLHMPLACAVIDEAHCVAEWGHSFRPAYFRLGEALQRDVRARCVLALTATATKATQNAVCSVLRIAPTQVLRDGSIRTNLRLHVERAPKTPNATKWGHIVSLFRKDGKLSKVRSSIVYCAWKGDADALAKALLGAGVSARAYHAGRHLKERSAVEAAFAAGKLRVVVATVAFGMGIDIASVQAVVHATMPRSLEEYVQQIGRAGRNGMEAQCFAFLSDADFVTLRSLAYSGIVSKKAVATVIDRIFQQHDEADRVLGSGNDGDDAVAAAYGCLPCRKLAGEVDMTEEILEALLGYLEADDDPYLRVLAKVALTVKVSFYAAAPEDLVEQYPIVSAVMKACPRARNGVYSVPTDRLACAAQKLPGAALNDLQSMAHLKLIGFQLSSETGPSYRVIRHPEDIDDLVDAVFCRLCAMLRCQVSRLDTSYRAFSAGAASSDQKVQEAAMRAALEEYFARDEDISVFSSGDALVPLELSGLPLQPAGESTLQAARAILRRNREQAGPPLSPLALARILHGTGSPSMPRDIWSKRSGAFWGSLRNVDFAAVVKACSMACKSLAEAGNV